MAGELIDQAEGTASAATELVLPSVSTTGTNVRLLALAAAQRVGGVIITPPSGWTSRTSGNFESPVSATRYHFMDRHVASGAGSPFADTVDGDDVADWMGIQIAMRAGVASPHTGNHFEQYECEDTPTNTATFDGGYTAVAGQVLVAALFWEGCEDSDYAGDSPWPVGWTRIATDSGIARLDSAYKIATGGETGVTATLLDSNAWWSDVVVAAYDPEEAAELEDCDAPLRYDVYSLGTATSPALTYLATLCDAFDKSFRVELDGTGSGRFSINRSSADATAAILGDGDGDVRYVKVRIPDVDDAPIFGFFIEKGDFRLLDEDEDGGETLTFEGHGSLAYLNFAVMLSESYLSLGAGDPIDGMDPFGGLWRLYLAGTGSKPGQMLARVIREATHPDRPQQPLPLLTYAFDYTDDSDGNTWASSDAADEFAAQINEGVLFVGGRLVGTQAITLQMSPDFVLGAYNSFGTDRTDTAFGAGKVRFVGGVNIAENLTRQIRPSRVATHVNVYGEEEHSAIAALADAASRVTREAGLSSTGVDEATLEAVGEADLAERKLRSESLRVRIAMVDEDGVGPDETAGFYLPGPDGTNGHFWVGDLITLHTGSGEFDYANSDFRVAAINVVEPIEAAVFTDCAVTVELGSVRIVDGGMSGGGGTGGTSTISSSPGGGSSGSGIVPTHSHPTDISGAELNRHGGQDVIFAHGSMGATETFNPADGNIHTGTLSANLTVTLTNPVGGRACTLFLDFTQDGTGGRTVTWPGSVTPVGSWSADTTAGVTVSYMLISLDGGTSWRLYLVGAGGASLTVSDEGTPLATAATELDFVGAGVVASGTGATKTITIAGATAADIAAMGFVGPILMVDGIDNPPEPLQNEAGDDWLYADIG